MRLFNRAKVAAATLLLFGAVGCADLNVVNPNDPDAGRALANAGDVESLIAGSLNNWFAATYDYNGAGLFLSNASFQHTAPWANAGMEFYGRLPRVSIVNDPAHVEYGQFTWAWYRNYRALAAVADGLKEIETNENIAADLGAASVLRATAFGKFVQGMSHASLAILYDQGFILDEDTETTDASGAPVAQTPVSYDEMLAAALGYFDEAIALSTGADFVIDDSWMTKDVTAAELVEIAHSMKARYRAAVARTPEERAAVNWDAVIADVDAGITEDWVMDMNWDLGWYNEIIDYGNFPGWAQMNYFISGMADQDGNYQRWLALPLGEKLPNPAGQDPILIITPDLRFPQGSTVEEQKQNPGTEYIIPCRNSEGYEACDISNSNIAGVWARPDRGSWRWSYYFSRRPLSYNFGSSTEWIEIDHDEMRLLKAEGLLRDGQDGAAAAIINVTREAAGLDDAQVNADCVPKLPNGECGDLMETLKWEKRHETRFRGLLGAPWYFDGRGWGDLYENTPLQFPAPCRELQVLNMLPCYTFGGGEAFSAPSSIYGIDD